MNGMDDDDISEGGLNPAGFTPNYGWPVKSRESGAEPRKTATPKHAALGWTLTALLVLGFVVLAVWIVRSI